MRVIKRMFILFMVSIIFLPVIPKEYAEAKDIEEMQASTLLITCGDLNAGSFGIGTGFVIGNSDHVVTNHHVIACGEGQPIHVVLDTGEAIPVTILWTSPEKDIAILQTPNKLDRPSVTFTKQKDVKVSDPVYVMGFPGAAADPTILDDSALITVKVATGIISAKVTGRNGVALYQTDAPINPGNSGGPLFTESGAVIGINSMASLVPVEIEGQGTDRVRLGDNIGWSIVIDELLVELDQLGIEYEVEGRKEPKSESSSLGMMTLILGIIAVILAGAALLLTMTKRGRVIVKQVSRRVMPNSQGATPGPRVAPPPVANEIGKPYLVGISGDYSGQKFHILQPLTLGRNAANSQIIISSNEISGTHCSIYFDKMQRLFFITDLGSTNGTFLEDGKRLNSNVKTPLQPNSKFFLANPHNSFEVRLESS